ncbi:hypothetical protein [Epilithonimonas caeni]|uniref:hypothetical protein n=1 Tax=Epilithonimonas caeni TaxID=365343 RepID=UPI000686E066|nr:hypothetical protein [Epilithonimonas caeni]
MTLKEFLEHNPIINNAQLARLMYPNNKYPNTKLASKLAENLSGSGKQRITEADEKLAKQELEKLVHRIVEYISN